MDPSNTLPSTPTSTAYISACGKYRYWLTRRWGSGELLAFLMLNPSTADHTKDDPTIRKCVGFAKRYGYDGIIVVNLFAYRATDPKELKLTSDPVGPLNDDVITSVSKRASMIVLAYGPHGSLLNRDKVVRGLLERQGAQLKCLHVTKEGYPGHPLMLGYERPLLEINHTG